MEEVSVFLKSRRKMNLLMVLINLTVFGILSLMGDTQDAYFMEAHGACVAPFVLNGEYYRIVTSMFLHFGLVHLVYNMICLIYMGDILEQLVGPVRYLIIYLLGGIAGNLLSLYMEIRSRHYAVSAGASGAIFAVIGALLYIVARHRGQIGELDGRRLAFMAILSISQGFQSTGTDNAAHVGGLMGGFLLAVLLYRKKSHSVKF